MSDTVERGGLVERVGAERAWAVLVTAGVALVGLGSVLFPRTVYANFVWHYFWGPVYADANNHPCTAWADGRQIQPENCGSVPAELGPVAEPGYTVVSEIGYVVILLIMLFGVLFLLRRLQLTRYRALFFALFPFMLFGGALRVVEDANNRAAAEGASQALTYPLNTLVISPLIYFTVFAFTLVCLTLAVKLSDRGVTERFERPLAALGFGAVGLCVGYLAFLWGTTDYVYFYPQVLLVTLVGATAVTGITWWLIERYKPEINAGTGKIGLVIIWGHAIDGTANVVGLDWGAELGIWYGDLVPKHPVNAAIVDVTQQVLPSSVLHYTGATWPFLLVKLVAATAVVWIFDEEVFEESPRYTILLLITVLAVGLGPGTRDMLRATFGV